MKVHAYTGTFYHELQVGPLVLQVRKRGTDVKRFRAWHDPYWRW